MKKKLLPLLLAVAMALLLLPAGAVTARADENVGTLYDLHNDLDSGGEIILTKDYTADSAVGSGLDNGISVSNIVSLDLNGHTIRPMGRLFNVYNSLTLLDSSEGKTGTITGGNAVGNGGGVNVKSGASFTMTGGSVTGNTAAERGDGGGVYVNSGASFTMTGGSITGNTATEGNGGGVYVYSGASFTMTGGSITGNNAAEHGDGVYVHSGGSFSLSGAPTIGGEVYLGGSSVITVTGELTNTDPIPVTMENPGVFTSGLSGKGSAANFVSSSANFGIRENGGEAGLYELYSISGTGSSTGGSVSASVNGQTVTQAAKIDTVILTVAPDVGWELAENGLTVTDADNNPVAVSENNTFTMPAGGVTVKADWKRNIGFEGIVINNNNGIASQDYDGAAHIPVITVTDTQRGTSPDFYTLNESDYTVSYKKDGDTVEKPVEAGEYTVILTGAGEDYTGSRSIPFIIRARLDTLRVSLLGWTNGMSPNTPYVTGNTGKGAVTYTYYTDAECKTKTTQAGNGAGEDGALPGRPGTYYVKATVAATDYYQSGEATAEFTIAKGQIPSFTVTMGSWLYGESHQAPACAVPSTYFNTSDVFYEVKKKGDPDTSYKKFRTTSTGVGEPVDEVCTDDTNNTWEAIVLDAGEYILRATIPENDKNPDCTKTTALTTFTVGKSKALVEVKGPYLEKDYDGTALTLTGSGTDGSTDQFTYTVSSVNGHSLKEGHPFDLARLSVSESNPAAAVSRTDAGTSYMGLTPENLISTEPNHDVTFTVARDGYVTIRKAEIDSENADHANYYTKLMTVSGLNQGAGPAASYTGAPVAVAVTNTDSGIGAVTVKYQKKTGEDSYDTASTEAPLDPGTYKVTLDVAEGKGYLAKSGIEAGTLTIAKVAYPGVKAISAYVTTAGGSGSVLLPALPEGASYGTPSCPASWLGNYAVNEGSLSYQAVTPEADTQATITIPVSRAVRYQDYDVTVTITVKGGTKTAVSIEKDDTDVSGGTVKVTYGNVAPAFSCEAAQKGTNGSFTWSSSNPDVAEVDENSGAVSIKGAGETRITAAYTSDEYFGTASVTLSVGKKPVTIIGVSAEDKEYDGTAAMKLSGSPWISRLAAGDEGKVHIASGTAAASDANAGEEKTVSFSGFALSGEAAGNYTLSGQPAAVTAKITPRKLWVSGITAVSREYQKDDKSVGLNFDGSALSGALTADAGAVSLVTEQTAGIMADDLPGAGKNVSITGLALAGTAAGNYRIDPDCLKATVTISKRSPALAPTLEYVGETLLGKADGRIKGVTTAMEYRRNYGAAGYGLWTPCPDGDLYPLAAGDYEVRYKETDTDQASGAQTITINQGPHVTMVVSFRFSDGTIQDTIPVELDVAANDGTITTEVKGAPGYSTEIGGLHYGTCFVEASYTYKLQDGGDPITATGSAQVETSAQRVQCEIILPKPGDNEARVETGSLEDAGLSTVQVAGLREAVNSAGLKDSSGNTVTNSNLRMTITSGGTEETYHTIGTDQEIPEKESILEQAKNACGEDSSAASQTKASFLGVDLKAISKADGSETALSETGEVLQLILPYDFTDRFDVLAWRYHDGKAEAFTRLADRPEGSEDDPYADQTFFPDEKNNRIYIYTNRFSTYAVTCTTMPKYTITLVKNDGTDAQEQYIVEHGETIKLANPFSRDGWTFMNWETGTDGGAAYADGQEVRCAQDLLLYAQWKQNTIITKEPASMPGLVYDGTEQALITEGEATGGTFWYAVTEDITEPDSSLYTKSVPAAVGAGTCYVWYMVKGDETHTDLGPQVITVTISKAEVAAPDIEGKPYTGQDQTAEVAESDLYTVTANSGGTDVGSYDVVLTLKDARNTKWSDSMEAVKTLQFGITFPTANTVTVEIEGWTYGETAKTPTSTADFGKAKYTYAAKGSDTYTDAVPTQAGEYTVKAVADATANYPQGAATKDFTIARADSAAATVTADGRVYDGTEKPLVVAAGEAAGGTMTYALGTAAEATEAYTPSIPSTASAGTYYVWYKVVGDSNHNDTEPASVPVTIAKASAPDADTITDAQKPTAKTGSDADYTGSPLALVTAPTALPTNYTGVQYSTDGGMTWSDQIPTGTAAGDYTVKVKYTSANYEDLAGEDVAVTIARVAPTVTAPTAKTLGCTGEAQELVNAGEATGGTLYYAVTTENTAPVDENLYTASIPTATDAGTYYIWYRVVGDANHSDIEPASVKVTINYTVTFETDGGTPLPEAQLVESGKNATYPDTAPTRDGSSFGGWYLDDEPFRFSSTPITGNITLTAKWKANQYTIIWVDDDGTYLAATTAAHGETPKLEAPAKLPDERFTYAFDAWTPALQPATETTVYRASYIATERVFTITVDNADANGSISAPESGSYQDAIALTVTPNEHYEIESVTYYDGSSHNVAPDGTGAYSFPMPAANVTVSAKFSPIVYTVSFDTDGGTPVPEAQRVEYGKYAAAPDIVPAKFGSRFEAWYLDDALFLFNTTPIEGNITLTAKWKADAFSIVWVDSDGAFLGTTTVSFGDTPTFAPPAKLPDAQFAYAFDAWDPAPQPATATAVYRATYTPVSAFGTPTFTLPASTISVGESAFEGLPMTIVEIPDGCTSIGAKAFKDCANLTQIRIPASVTSIDATAFEGCANVFVYGTAGSAAQTFCADHANCAFVAEN